MPDLVPLRALNQVTYCPRLYYLQYVDNLMPVNEHVEGGLFDHRRVDDPGLANRSRKDGDTVCTRSVAFTSETLGLTGVLDQIESRAGEEYPVETKHGSAPHDDNGHATAWDNDAVQLCGQALLLEEETGMPVPRGAQFYVGSRERVVVEFDEALRAKTLSALQLCKDLSQQDAPPEPLPAELRHRCFGCSLAPVCLPEETLFQIGHPTPGEQAAGITRVIPCSDDGAVLYVQEPGSRVGKRSEHLVVKKDNREIEKVPMHAIRQLVLFGNVQISTQALQTLIENEIGVALLTGHAKFIGMVQPAPAKNVGLREAQYRRFSDPATCLTYAKACVRAKLINQRTMLMRNTEGKDELAAQGLADLIRKVEDAAGLDSLLGLEGQGASLYFGEFGRFLKAQPPGQGFDFRTRNRRPPTDPVNALLSFAYALLTKDCFAAVCTVGFDPWKGFFHANRHGKPSLALDLMEEFRTIIADSVVLTLINNAMLDASDFLVWRGACHLTERGRKAFFTAYEARRATEITHPVYGYRMSYSRMLEVQARMLAAAVRGSIPTYTGFTVR